MNFREIPSYPTNIQTENAFIIKNRNTNYNQNRLDNVRDLFVFLFLTSCNLCFFKLIIDNTELSGL